MPTDSSKTGLAQFEATVGELRDRQAIERQLANHSRGVDRCDTALLKSVYHPDAEVAYGFFDGPAPAFSEILTDSLRQTPLTMHRTGNISIRLKQLRAHSESYVLAYMALQDATPPAQALILGRYLDRHEQRAGHWRLNHRTYVLDGYLERPAAGDLNAFAAASGYTLGGRGADDPVHANLSTLSDHPAPTGSATEETDMQVTAALIEQAEVALAKVQIHELIMAQARATDRGDQPLLESLWHPQATVDVGIFTGSANDYCPMIIEATAVMTQLSHTIANEWIDVRGNEAVSECYVIAFATYPDAGGTLVSELTGGRYFDRFARLDGQWKFTRRQFVADWQTQQAATVEAADGPTAALKLRGRRGADDPVYRHWNT